MLSRGFQDVSLVFREFSGRNNGDQVDFRDLLRYFKGIPRGFRKFQGNSGDSRDLGVVSGHEISLKAP